MSEPHQELKIADTRVGSQVAHASVVNANGGLVTLDFVYIHPRQAGQVAGLEGQVVSRVTMTYADAKNFAGTLDGVLSEHGKKYTED